MIKKGMCRLGLVNKVYKKWDSKIISVLKMEERCGDEKLGVL